VASEALGADRALRRALFRQPPEARENEAAPLEEIGDEREREHSAESKPARLGDAREDQMPSDPATRCLGPHRERAHLGQIGREDRERAASQEPGRVLGDHEIAEVLEQEIARTLEHPVLGRVAIDEGLHFVDVLDARRTDGHAHFRSASVASASASRTRSGAVPPGEERDASDRSGRISSSALASKRLSYPRSSLRVTPPRSMPATSRSRTILPTISCASRNGTPCFARWSARSVAASIPRSVARRIASRSQRTPRTTSARTDSASAK